VRFVITQVPIVATNGNIVTQVPVAITQGCILFLPKYQSSLPRVLLPSPPLGAAISEMDASPPKKMVLPPAKVVGVPPSLA